MAKIPIPLIDESSTKEVIVNVNVSYKKSHLALAKEIKAISLIEKEIESWQK